MSQMGKFISTSALGAVDTLTGNVGGAVSPDGVGNIDFTGAAGQITVTGTPATNSLVASITNGANGQILIGGGAAATWANIASASGTIVITNGANAIDLSVAGIVSVSFPTDAGTATPAIGVLTIAGGTNINTSGAGSVVSVNLDAAISGMTAVDFAAGGRIGTATGAGNTLLLQAYDVDGAVYTTFATLTANNTPTMDLDDAVTKASGYIYRAGGTDVPVADGGTGTSSLTDHSLLVGSGTAAVTALGSATDGQLPIGSTGADPVLATLTAGTGIQITNSAGSITISSPDSGVQWTEVTGTSVGMAVNNGYILNNAGLVTATLPATAAVGDVFIIIGKGAGGWKMAQNAGQTTHYISLDTTTGAGGSLASTVRYDCIEVVCVTADTDFVVRSSTGNITVV